jgi:hypothetical protein
MIPLQGPTPFVPKAKSTPSPAPTEASEPPNPGAVVPWAGGRAPQEGQQSSAPSGFRFLSQKEVDAMSEEQYEVYVKKLDAMNVEVNRFATAQSGASGAARHAQPGYDMRAHAVAHDAPEREHREQGGGDGDGEFAGEGENETGGTMHGTNVWRLEDYGEVEEDSEGEADGYAPTQLTAPHEEWQGAEQEDEQIVEDQIHDPRAGYAVAHDNGGHEGWTQQEQHEYEYEAQDNLYADDGHYADDTYGYEDAHAHAPAHVPTSAQAHLPPSAGAGATAATQTQRRPDTGAGRTSHDAPAPAHVKASDRSRAGFHPPGQKPGRASPSISAHSDMAPTAPQRAKQLVQVKQSAPTQAPTSGRRPQHQYQHQHQGHAQANAQPQARAQGPANARGPPQGRGLAQSAQGHAQAQGGAHIGEANVGGRKMLLRQSDASSSSGGRRKREVEEEEVEEEQERTEEFDPTAEVS